MLARFWMIITVLTVITMPAVGADLKIASWNIRDLGQAKAGLRGDKHRADEAKGKKATLEKIVEIIEGMEVDLIIIQEVQDKEYRTLPKLLCALGADNWEYIQSERTGKAGQEEQYAVFFDPQKLKAVPKDTIYLYDGVKMERLPGYCRFETKKGGFDFTIITCHNRTWGEGAAEEAKLLDDVYKGVQESLSDKDNDIILLGDFNIEGGKVKAEYEKHFEELLGLGIEEAICFGKDTMVSESNDSTVDNIFYPKHLTSTDHDVFRFDDKFGKGYDKEISDHYPVWATFEIPAEDNED